MKVFILYVVYIQGAFMQDLKICLSVQIEMNRNSKL